MYVYVRLIVSARSASIPEEKEEDFFSLRSVYLGKTSPAFDKNRSRSIGQWFHETTASKAPVSYNIEK